MAASLDGTHDHTHAAGCGCVACAEAASSGDVSGSTGGTVTDYTALLYYPQNDNLRWNAQTDLGTQVVITYAFTETADLPSPSGDPFGATSYWAYNAAQRTLFREVAAQYEAIGGVRFVEIEGPAMINVYGSVGGTAGGWANIAYATDTSTGDGSLTNNYMNMDEGDYGYQVNLHELGHAMGLQHPHEGPLILDPSVDTQANTVMTYNIGSPYVSTLGGFDILAIQEIYGTSDAFDGWLISVDANDVVTITSTDDAETVLATGQATIINAGRGADEVFGREADDYASGGHGRDTMSGGLGNDTLYGNNGLDLLIGDMDTNPWSGEDKSNDRLYGNGGDDTLYGGDGQDQLYGGGRDDYLDGGYGRDFLRGGNGDDTLTGGDGNDRLAGDNGNDVFLFLNADAYDDDRIIDFTQGEDLIDVSVFGFSAVSQFTQTVVSGDLFLTYSNWINIELSNFTGTLTDSDFIFAP